jgi:hypothetical protein
MQEDFTKRKEPMRSKEEVRSKEEYESNQGAGKKEKLQSST